MNIYKIAEIAGVSISTVSKVINGKSDIGKATREKVLQIIEDNGYKPKISTAGMDTIAIFAPIDKETHISNPYFSGILSGVGEVAYDYDFGITIISTRRVPKNSRDFLAYCRQRKIRGGIFPLLTYDDNYVVNFADKFPTVVLSYQFGDSPIGSVLVDNFNGGYEAVKHMVELEHKKIMFVNPSPKYIDHIQKLEGGEKALKEANLVRYPNDINNSLALSDMDLGYHFNTILESGNRPSAMFIASDQEALRIMRVLQEKGIRVPEDISIVGFDNLYFAANTNPPLTTVHQPIFDVGKAACRMLIEMMGAEKDQVNNEAMLKTQLIVRKSTAKFND